MFKKLKTKIILVSSTAIFVFLVLILLTINIINYKTVVNEADRTLEKISRDFDKNGNKPPFQDNNPNHMPPEFSPESRFFTIKLDSTNNILEYDTSLFTINANEITDYANKVIQLDKEKGFVDDFRFLVINKNSVKTIIFLDCSRNLNVYLSFMFASIFIAIISLIIIVGILWILSNSIIKPFALNYEKQKTFITDASHELKTPLTIINTNIDILEMEYGNNESFSDIHTQIDRLRDLTNNLVLLSKMEESDNHPEFIELPISDIIIESIIPFKNFASSQNKLIKETIEDFQTIKGNDKLIRQLLTILLDNAVKYSKENSTIEIIFTKHKNNHLFIITNESSYPLDKEKINYVFDRFYRLDSSRNSSTGGHGIGLSIAKAIADTHNIKINASIIDENKFQILLIFNH